MRRLIAVLGLILVMGCNDGDGGGSSASGIASDTATLESAQLRARSDGGCELFGTVFNTSGSNICDVFVNTKAISRSGTVLDDGIDQVENLAPQSRGNYATVFFGVPCSSIDHTEQDLDQFCGDAFRG